MTSKLKVNLINDSGDNNIITSDGAGVITSSKFKIGQVVSTNLTGTFSTTSTTYVDATGLSVSITPTSTSSKILIQVTLGSFVNDNSNARAQGRVMRDSTVVAVGDAATGEECTFAYCSRTGDSNHHQVASAITLLDSPSTTSATTYKIQVQRGPDAAGTVRINRSGAQDANSGNSVSSITVMEVLP